MWAAEAVKAVMTGAIEEVTGVVELGGAGTTGMVEAGMTEATLAASLALWEAAAAMATPQINFDKAEGCLLYN